jgi:hypothetical protein
MQQISFMYYFIWSPTGNTNWLTIGHPSWVDEDRSSKPCVSSISLVSSRLVSPHLIGYISDRNLSIHRVDPSDSRTHSASSIQQPLNTLPNYHPTTGFELITTSFRSSELSCCLLSSNSILSGETTAE